MMLVKGNKSDKDKGKDTKEKKNVRIKRGKKISKFKYRSSQYLYTFKTQN